MANNYIYEIKKSNATSGSILPVLNVRIKLEYPLIHFFQIFKGKSGLKQNNFSWPQKGADRSFYNGSVHYPLPASSFPPVNSWMVGDHGKQVGIIATIKVFVSRSKLVFYFWSQGIYGPWKYPILSWAFPFFQRLLFFMVDPALREHSFWISSDSLQKVASHKSWQQVLGIVVDLGALCLKFILGPQFSDFLHRAI